MIEGTLIRDLTPEDLEKLSFEESRTFDFPWSLKDFSDVIKASWPALVMFDEDQTKLLAWCIALPVLDEADILTIGVNVEYQRRGLGRQMLRSMLALMKKRGISRVHLEVRESNMRARALYESEGFMLDSVRRGYYPANNGREDAIMMTVEI